MEHRSLLSRILETAALLALSAFLIRLAACFLCSVWPVLVISAVIALAAIVLYRIWKHKRDTGKW